MARLRTNQSGMTLVELLVAVAILVVLGLMILAAVTQLLRLWSSTEHRANQYTTGQVALDQMIDDLSCVVAREPVETNLASIRFICIERPRGGQVLSFVRSFENGPERVQTFDAGAEGRRGEAYDLRDDDGDGFVDNNLQPLGGMAEVIYYLDDRKLMRGISAPVRATGNNLFSGRAQPLIDNVLYLGFRFWGEFTRGWEDAPLPPSHSGQVHQIGTNPHVATRIWDSTRGFSIQGLERFPLHVNPKLTPDGKGSLADFSDDVFPEMVQITLVVEGDPRRAPRAHLSVPVTEAATRLVVDSTEGFPDVPAGTQGGVDCHILVGNEWMRYSQKGDDYFVIAERGARRTSRTVHEAGAEVRVGKTFVTRVYIPAWRENLEPEGRTRRGFLQ